MEHKGLKHSASPCHASPVIARSPIEEFLEGRFREFVPIYTDGSVDAHHGPATAAFLFIYVKGDMEIKEHR